MLANKLTVYQLQDSQTGKVYKIEGPEGASEEELSSFLEQQLSTPSQPAQPEQPQAQPQVTVGQGRGAATPSSATVATQDVQSGMEMGVDKALEHPVSPLSDEDAQTYLSMTRDPNVPAEKIASWLSERGKLWGPESAGQLAEYRKAIAEGKTTSNNISYQSAATNILPPENPQIDPGVGGVGAALEEGMAYNPMGAVARLVQDWMDIPQNGVTKEDIKKRYPNLSDSDVENIHDSLIGELRRRELDNARYQVEERGINPALRMGANAAGSLSPLDIVPMGKGITGVAMGAAYGAGSDALMQAQDLAYGARDSIDPAEIAQAGAEAAAFQGVAEGAIHGIKKISSMLPTRDSAGTPVPPEPIAVPTSRKNTKKYGQQLDETRQGIADHINHTVQGWTNAPEFEAHPNFKNFPEAEPDAIALIHDGKVVINTERLLTIAKREKMSPEELTSAVVYHEALGHHGLAQKFGDNLDAVLNDFYDNGVKTFKDRVDTWLTDNPKAYTKKLDGTAYTPEERRRMAIEEVLAEDSEKGRIPVTLKDRISNLIKDFARSMNLNLKYSDREIRAILGMAHEATINGKPNDVRGNGFKYMNIGDNANHPVDRLSARIRAASMADRGVSQQEIFDKTGWWQDRDGGWRTRLADNESKLLTHEDGDSMLNHLTDVTNVRNGERVDVHNLDEVLHHPKLFEAYPELRKIVIAQFKHRDVLGTFDRTNNAILLNLEQMKKQGYDPHSTILHELQHAIQEHEGWAQGGNVNSALDLTLKDHEIPVIAKNIMSDLEATYDQTLQWYYEVKRKPSKFVDPKEYLHDSEEFLTKLEKQMEKLSTLIRKGDRNELLKYIRKHKEVKYEAYKMLMGEIEARETQATMGLDQQALNKQGRGVGAVEKWHPDYIRIVKDGKVNAEQTVYHGSPHEFDEFDHEHMGKGEGHQAFGWGTYLTESKAVAEDYKRKLSAGRVKRDHETNEPILKGMTFSKWWDENVPTKDIRNPEVPDYEDGRPAGRKQAARYGKPLFIKDSILSEKRRQDLYDILTDVDSSPSSIIRSEIGDNRELLREIADELRYADDAEKPVLLEQRQEAVAWGKMLEKAFSDVETREGKLYHVELPDDARWLEWDKALDEQPAFTEKLHEAGWKPDQQAWRDVEHERIAIKQLKFGSPERKAAVAEARKKIDYLKQNKIYNPRWSGERLYNQLANTMFGESPRKASEYLDSIGVTGTKYLDGFSRRAGEGSYNYVVYHDKTTKITAKYMRDYTKKEAEERSAIHSARDTLKGALDNYVPLTRNWEEAKAAARERGLSPSDVRRAKKLGHEAFDKKLFQYDEAARKTDERIATLKERIDSGKYTPADKANYLQAVFAFNEMTARIWGHQAEIARALNAMKAIQYSKNKLGQLNELLKEFDDRSLGGFADEQTFRDFTDQVKYLMDTQNANGAHTIMRNVMKPYWWEYILTFRHVEMLSSLGTQAKNAKDNALMVSRNLEEKILAMPGFAVRKALGTVEQGVSPQEVAGHFYGLLRAALDSETYVKTAQAWWNGPGHRIVDSKLEIQGARIPVLSKVSDTLHAADVFFRAFHDNANLYSLGVRRAREEGFTGLAAFEEGSNYAVNPSERMLKETKKLTNEALLVDTPSGIAQKLEAAKSIRPNMDAGAQAVAFGANFVLPFFRVTDRLLFQAIRRSPLSFLDRNTRADFKAGGARRDIAIARTLFGSALMYYWWNQAGEKKVVGNGPDDYRKLQALQAGGYKTNSVVEDGKYVDATALNLSAVPWDPQNQVAANVATIREAYENGKADKEQTAAALGMAFNGLLTVLTSSSFAENISTWVEPFQHSSRDNGGARANLAANVAGTFLPAGMRQYNQAIADPVQRDTTGDGGFEDRVKGRLMSSIPGLSDKLPVKNDLYGDPMEQGRSISGLNNYQTIKTDDVSKELQRLERTTDKPVVTAAKKTFQLSEAADGVFDPKYVSKVEDGQVHLNAAGHQEWQRVQGFYLKQGMKQLIHSGQWKALNDDQKIKVVKQLKKEASEATKEYMVPQLGLKASSEDEDQ